MTESTCADRGRLLFPALGGLYAAGAPLSYAFMRFSAGAVLFPHGVDKLLNGSIVRSATGIANHGLPFPLVLAGLTVVTESVGAACLALGLFTRIAAAAVWIEMSVIVIFYQWPNGYFWTNKGYEFALLWWLLATAIFFRGGGRYALDRLIGKEF